VLSTIKLYLYAALAALLLSGFGWYTYHERAVEHAKDVAVATKAVAKVEKQDVAIAATATTEIQHDTIIYKQAVSVPAVGDIGVVCSAPRGDAVPGAAVGGPVPDAAAVGGVGPTFDPSGQILTIGRDADAKIVALQNIIRELQAEMAAAAKAHQ
jgi:hypothetical protein